MVSRSILLFLIVISGLIVSIGTSQARVHISIDISTQRMAVYTNGRLHYHWPVSTGRRRYSTPLGTFRPTRLERDWYSRKYNWSPMPHSIFFYGGVAIHGTYHTHLLGRRASRGCVRLAPRNARRLFNLVRRYGARRTRIAVKY